MKYILADKEKCERQGMNLRGTIEVDGKVVVGERLLMDCSPGVSGSTLEEKTKAVDGELLTLEEVKGRMSKKLNNGSGRAAAN
jgi:hypothetical protein|nr:MAG TPA: hypothetical protein [Caudoviricetes sp.]